MPLIYPVLKDNTISSKITQWGLENLKGNESVVCNEPTLSEGSFSTLDNTGKEGL